MSNNANSTYMLSSQSNSKILSLNTLVSGCLYLFAFSIPCEEVFKLNNLAPGLPVISLSRILGFILIVLFSLELTLTRKIRRHGGEDLILISISYAFLILTAFTGSFGEPARAFSAFNVLAMCLIVQQKVTSLNELRTITRFFFAGTLVTLLALVIGKFLGLSSISEESSFGRQRAFGFDKNVTAYIISMGFACAIYWQSFSKSRLLFFLPVAYAILGLYGIILTGSKSGMALFCLVGMSYFLTGKNAFVVARRLALVVALMATAGPIIISYAPEHQLARISTTFDSVRAGNLTGREVLWKAGMEQFFENPMAGVGLGGFQNAIGLGNPAHNAFIQVAVEAGMIGLVLYTLSLIFPMRRIIEFNRPEMIFLSSILFCQFLGIFFLNWYIHKMAWLWISVLCAVSCKRGKDEGHIVAKDISPSE